MIEEAYFSDAEGRRHSGAGGVLQLFLCIDQEPSVVETETEVLQSFIILTDQKAEFAHRALVTLLSAFSRKQKPLSWQQVLMTNQLPTLSGGPRQAAKNALEEGLLQHVFAVPPQTMQEFLNRGIAR